ncbi:hypothetical protein GCM10010415_20290 [Streptomyces atrovirens]
MLPSERGRSAASAATTSGCPFRTRCWKADDACATVFPAASDGADGHRRHCVHPRRERCPPPSDRRGGSEGAGNIPVPAGVGVHGNSERRSRAR